MPKQANSTESNQPAPVQAVAQAAPQATQFAPVVQVPAAKRSCLGTSLIVVVTVICTIIAEVAIGFALAGYFINSSWQNIRKEWSAPTESTTGDSTSGSAAAVGGAQGTTQLTADQKKMLQSFGIDPNDLPEDIPIQQITCVQNSVGADRINDIISGKETPGFKDLWKAKSCF